MRANVFLRSLTTLCILAAGFSRAASTPPTTEIGRFFDGRSSWDEAVSALVHALNDHEAAGEAAVPHDSSSPIYAEHDEIGGPLGEAFMQSRSGSGHALASGASSSSLPLVNQGATDPRPSGSIPVSLTFDPTPSHTNDHVPHLEIKPLSVQERSEILHDLHLAMSRRHFKDGRQLAWPLLMENLSPVDYQNLYNSLTAPRYGGKENVRHLWNRNGVTYSFSRPRETSVEFVRMHGSDGMRNEKIYAVWRLEYYEQTKIWRYLGAVKVPGRRPLATLTRARLSRYWSVSRPTDFWNDAAHIDPDQTSVPQGQIHF